jgi:hypothetical protein
MLRALYADFPPVRQGSEHGIIGFQKLARSADWDKG